MALPPKYKIHPAIGIARLGNSDEYFIGQESPFQRPSGPFKKSGKIKPQAAKFRVFEYIADKKGMYKWNREINLGEKDVNKLVWSVHIANRKGSFFKFNGLKGFERGVTKRRNGVKNASERKSFEIDPGKRIITGKNIAPKEIKKSKKPSKQWWPSDVTPRIETLGRLATDSDGNLLVIGGRGVTGKKTGAAPISDYANNDGWFDDTADGSINVYLKIKGKRVTVEPSWVISAPPDFAPHLANVVTLYDVLFDMAARKMKLPKNESIYTSGELKNLQQINLDFKNNSGKKLSSYNPDFDSEIFPILKRTIESEFVFGPAVGRHGTMKNFSDLGDNTKAKEMRQFIFNFLRSPDTSPSNDFPNMPKLLGDEPYQLIGGVIHKRVRATLTKTQYALLERWVNGHFISGKGVFGPMVGPFPLPTPYELDRAALESCVGAAMYPGIEVSWQIRWQKIFSAPFRINHLASSPYPGDKPKSIRAGHFTRQMALPWQADFLQCKKESVSTGRFIGDWGWWPAQRPDEVFESTSEFKKSPPEKVEWSRATAVWPSGAASPNYEEMIENWYKFGFVVEDPANPGVFIESERDSHIP